MVFMALYGYGYSLLLSTHVSNFTDGVRELDEFGQYGQTR